MRREDEVIVGGPGPRTSAAMRAGKLMTAERSQAANEAARRGERPSAIPDRTANPIAVRIQRQNEKLRGEVK